MTDLAALRSAYGSAPLGRDDVDPDPVQQWRRWFDQAVEAEVAEPAGMVVATTDGDGVPDARFVLVRGVDERGFAFYTNLTSAKSRQLADRPSAALVFGWLELHRQVRVRGSVERVGDDDADAYWATRPRGSQVGAWASPQSDVLPDRAGLERRVAEVEARFAGGDVPRPPFWSGWRVVPSVIELWQGRRDRLHDRLRYRRDDVGHPWVIERLAP